MTAPRTGAGELTYEECGGGMPHNTSRINAAGEARGVYRVLGAAPAAATGGGQDGRRPAGPTALLVAAFPHHRLMRHGRLVKWLAPTTSF